MIALAVIKLIGCMVLAPGSIIASDGTPMGDPHFIAAIFHVFPIDHSSSSNTDFCRYLIYNQDESRFQECNNSIGRRRSYPVAVHHYLCSRR